MICFGFSEWAGLGFGWDQIRQATVSDVWLLEKCIESVYKLRVLFLLSKQCGRHGITCIPICKEESYWNVLPVHVSFSVFSSILRNPTKCIFESKSDGSTTGRLRGVASPCWYISGDGAGRTGPRPGSAEATSQRRGARLTADKRHRRAPRTLPTAERE